MKKLIMMILVAGCFALGAYADVSYSFNGGMMTITAPSTLAGKGIRIVWDTEDRGLEPAAWANVANVVDAVPAAGGTYTIDLESLGIANGQSCRIVTSTRYRLLDKLQMTSNQTYVNTGIKDINVYGIRFGYYATGKSADFGGAIGTGEGSNYNGGFIVGANNTTIESWFWAYQGKKYTGNDRPKVSTSEINEAAFTNCVFSLGGVAFKTGLPVGAVAKVTDAYSGANMYLGRSAKTESYMYGWWSHVSFDDASGNRILDYVPVQRASDGKVGFYNRIGEGSFVASSGSDDFTAGTFTNAYIDVDMDATQTFSPNRIIGASLDKATLTVAVPAGLGGEQLLVLWDDEDKGTDISAWAHTNVVVESIANNGGTYTVKLTRLGVGVGKFVRVAAANCYKTLDKLQMTTTKTYVDTGIKGYNVYGLRFGFYPTGKSGTGESDLYSAVNCGKDNGTSVVANRGGFSVCVAKGKELDHFRFLWRGASNDIGGNLVNTDGLNEYAFTNGVCTLNGVLRQSNLASGAISTNDHNVFLGKCSYTTYSLYGWWSHVSFDDASGNRILDYVPVQRVSDGKVGFYDRATLSFVTSSGTGDFTAGTVTDDTPVTAVNSVSAPLQLTSIPGLIITIF